METNRHHRFANLGHVSRCEIFAITAVLFGVLTAGQGCVGTQAPPSASDSSDTTTLDDGHKICNVAADFVAYAEQAGSADAAGRQTQWDQMLEAKYADFFNQIVYGNLTG